MTQPRTRLPRDPVERRVALLTAAQQRHNLRQKMARLERAVAELGDPTVPTSSEIALRASSARLEALMREATNDA